MIVRLPLAGYYTTRQYIIAKLLCDGVPLRIVPPLLFTAITCYMTGLHSAPDRVVAFIGISTLLNVTVTAICYVMAALTATLQQANLLSALVFTFNFLFGGFLLTARNAVVSGIMHVSVFNWAWKVCC